MKKIRKTIFTEKHERLIAKLVSLRTAKGMTQRDLAAKLKVPNYYVGRIEIRNRRLDFIELVDILKALELSDKEILKLFSEFL